ncbi:MAG: flavodoxin [bacterium]|nr:flavodoxin [bacterium]
MKRIVIYYSLEGNTEKAAKQIAEALEAELVRIEPVKSIPTDSDKKFMVGGMQAMFDICPKLQNERLDEAAYDQIILGTPVWAGKCASPVRSFIKKNHLNEKVTAVFTCSGGGDNDGCIANLKKLLHHIQYTVALADQNNQELSGKNESRLAEFIEQLKHISE